MNSIISNEKKCFLCGTTRCLERHHIVFGAGRRKLSEEDGLWVWLCHSHHNEPPHGAHFDRELDLYLKRTAQQEYEKTHTRQDWMKRYGRNYAE